MVEIHRLRDGLDLWFAATNRDHVSVRRILDPIKRGGPFALILPAVRSEDELEYAKQIVVTSANIRLSPSTSWNPPCHLAGCAFGETHRWMDSTLARIRTLNAGHELVIAASNLLKVIWLQFAAYIVGQRRVKRCEAPDCARYMDVTGSKRPGARRFHPQCEERFKKQRYRKRKEV
jgi:hypothetical protein